MVWWVWPCKALITLTQTCLTLINLQYRFCVSLDISVRFIVTFSYDFRSISKCTVPFAMYPITFFIASSCCPSLDDSRAFLRSSNFFEPAKSAESSAVPELLSSLITRLWRISLQKGRFFLSKKRRGRRSYSPSLSFVKSFSLGGTVFNYPPTRCRQKVPLWLNRKETNHLVYPIYHTSHLKIYFLFRVGGIRAFLVPLPEGLKKFIPIVEREKVFFSFLLIYWFFCFISDRPNCTNVFSFLIGSFQKPI